MKTPKILAYTCTYGHRPYRVKQALSSMRGRAGLWFDWLWYGGNISEEVYQVLCNSLDDETGGIQHLHVVPENRGQHHATAYALEVAREGGYEWLLRLDDDIKPKTERWLKKMVERAIEIRQRAGDEEGYRFAYIPRIVGLRNRLPFVGTIDVGQNFRAELMKDNIGGGACRLIHLNFFKDYRPWLDSPLGRRDPESIGVYLTAANGACIRYPDIRVEHRTDDLEALDTFDQKHARKMSHYWPYIGPGDAFGTPEKEAPK